MLQTLLKRAEVRLLLAFYIFLFPFTAQVNAQELILDTPTQIMEVESKKVDPRVIILRDYLAKYNSPLKDNAKDFVDAADQYQIDWRLVPAIAGVESTFGKAIPGGFNGWGWGVYGDQALYFGSWKAGIYTVTKGLKEDYYSRGLIEPYSINTRYATSKAWGRNVSYFIGDIEKFAKTHPESKPKVDHTSLKLEESGTSARLALSI